ncbi:hypothetical protein [Planctomicrobium piriforme]|uniref:Uncharacterized protein n=1 Tax=Planctomicrobium piriforme TaxID=1576369 RepID=A0A1I3BLQ2_9PLAN|nr:hypothetical protein [Planctomicrobium piriforme]SFH63225.1 hypothetical protein SAMN05421753_101526 [Planctomicrobium piriforme]
MPPTPFEEIEQAFSREGADAAFERLTAALREQKEWHNLFDARMLQKKQQLNLPLLRPSSLQDVPEPLRKEVEAAYVVAAREAGEGFLAQGDILSAWMYLKAIREPEKVAAALEALPNSLDDYQQLEQLTRLALYEGVHPEKGLKMMLRGHGTCSTITALDQVFPQLTAEQRSRTAQVMVRALYDELTESVQRHVEKRMPMLPPGLSLEKLIAGRDWLFEGGNYHVDVSHLSSIVRFARSIAAPADELDLARQLAIYGSKLEPSLQYGGEPPFGDFYPAHLAFFDVLLNRNVDAGLKYFRTQLDNEPDEQDKPLFAYVLVDLLVRADRLSEAVDVAAKHLTNLSEDVSISFDELCEQAGRMDVLKQVRRDQKNLVGFTSALVRETKYTASEGT